MHRYKVKVIRDGNSFFLLFLKTTKAFLPSMIEDNRGHIVSIASMAGHIGVSHLVSYCTSKFAAIGFDEALHMELVVSLLPFLHQCRCFLSINFNKYAIISFLFL